MYNSFPFPCLDNGAIPVQKSSCYKKADGGMYFDPFFGGYSRNLNLHEQIINSLCTRSLNE